MRLEREGASGLAVVMPSGERWLVTRRGITSYMGGANDWSGERGRWTEATLHREGESLVVRILEIVDHEGGRNADTVATFRSDLEGRLWTDGAASGAPSGPPVAELSTDIQRLDRLGDYRVILRVGAGSLGDLYEAFGPDGERVMVRVVRAHDEPDVRAALAVLGPRLTRVQHRHLLRVHAVSELADGRWLVASDFAYGPTLEDAPVEPGRAPFVGGAILGAVDALHAEGVVHGDIQPSTIFFDQGCPRLADAALGIVLGDRRGKRRTRSAARIDLAYAPPELLERLPLEPRSDVYAVGACLYTMLAGRPPFWAESSVALGVQVLTKAPAPLAPSANVSPALVEVVSRAMARRPEDRFSTAAEMREALARA